MRATAILGEGSEFDVLVEYEAAPIGIEIAQSHAGDLAQVTHKVTAELLTYVNGQTEITVGIDPPEGDPVWGEDIDVGDQVFVDGAWREVVAYAGSIDDEGGPPPPGVRRRRTIVPQFGVVLDEPDQRIVRTFRAIGGLSGGTSHIARLPATVSQPNNRP